MGKVWSRSAQSPLALGVGTAVGVFLLATAYRRIKRVDDKAEPGECKAELNKQDKFMILSGEPPVTTITWFRGDHNQASRFLQTRIAEIVQANPWLSARLTTRDGTKVLVYGTRRLKHFKHVAADESPISRNDTMRKSIKRCTDFMANNKSFMWRVTVVPCASNPSTYFAMVVSMSHILGDGHTFYSIHNMLSASGSVQQLSAIRVKDLEEDTKNFLGDQYERNTSPAVIGGFLLGMLYTCTFARLSNTTLTTRVFLIDTARLPAVKTAAAKEGEVPFVSTNDVLSSWFLRGTECTSGTMVIDLRNRLPRLKSRHAGNYVDTLHYRDADFASPALIRKSLPNCKRAVTHEQPLPGFLEGIKGSINGRYGMVDSWTSSAKGNTIEGCEEEFHYPFVEYTSFLPVTMVLAIFFRAGPGKIGVHATGTPQRLSTLKAEGWDMIEESFV